MQFISRCLPPAGALRSRDRYSQRFPAGLLFTFVRLLLSSPPERELELGKLSLAVLTLRAVSAPQWATVTTWS